MATAVVLPRLGNTVESCLIVKWLKAKGDAITAGDPLVEIETDKSVLEIEAPATGILLDVFFDADADVPVMTNIGVIGTAGEDITPFRPTTVAFSQKTEATISENKQGSAPVVEFSTTTDPEIHEFSASPRARKLAKENHILIDNIEGSGPHGRIIERDVRSALASASHLSMSARELFQNGKYQVPPFGSGPGGLVLKDNLIQAPQSDAAYTLDLPHTVTLVKGIRKLIAERMHSSLATTAQLTMHTSARAANVIQAAKQSKLDSENNITINDIMIYVTSKVLMQYPALNAHFFGDRIIQYEGVNIGVAIDTPRGLMVPNIKYANDKTIQQISSEIKELAKAAHAGDINPDHLKGGTFTVTNLGVLGIEYFTPVLNAPEVAILGVGGLCLRPFDIDNKIEFLKTIGLSLTIDHQAVDGAPAAKFLRDLVLALESFTL